MTLRNELVSDVSHIILLEILQVLHIFYLKNLNYHRVRKMYFMSFALSIWKLWGPNKKKELTFLRHRSFSREFNNLASGYVDQFPAWVHATFQYTQLCEFKERRTSASKKKRGQHKRCRRRGRFIPTITQPYPVLRIRP